MERAYENGNKVSEKYFDVDGNPMTVGGYHEIRYDYDERGNDIRWSYLDTEGNLANNGSIAIIEHDYDDLGNVIETQTYTADHQLVSKK